MAEPSASTHAGTDNNQNNGESTVPEEGGFGKNEDEDYGYYFYPHRETPDRAQQESVWNKMWEGRKAARKFKCEANVRWCLENNPIVKLLAGALKSQGCPVDLRRHVSCEPCIGRVNGGYDPQTNQVVVCENVSTSRGIACNVLAHEFVHAFDYCRAKVDFENLEHLACTEIRAANLMHCPLMSALSTGEASPWNIKAKHKDCVKKKALMSVLMVRNVSMAEATAAVEKVFEKCYADLEPLGRRPRKGSRDGERALSEGSLYGYVN